MAKAKPIAISFSRYFSSTTLIIAALLAQACGSFGGTSTTTTTAGTCNAGTAVIVVYDGYFQNVCGCQETSGVTVTPNLFTCTVNAGTSVTFLVARGTRFTHQIVPVGTPALLPGPASSPEFHPLGLAHVVNPSTPGTYLFEDSFVPGSQGRLIVL
jgi:hypothetical protein